MNEPPKWNYFDIFSSLSNFDSILIVRQLHQELLMITFSSIDIKWCTGNRFNFAHHLRAEYEFSLDFLAFVIQKTKTLLQLGYSSSLLQFGLSFYFKSFPGCISVFLGWNSRCISLNFTWNSLKCTSVQKSKISFVVNEFLVQEVSALWLPS